MHSCLDTGPSIPTSHLYIVRHGETDWNRESRFQGGKNSPLTKKGKVQATQTSSLLADIPLTRVYVSKLGRAIETTRIILNNRAIEYTTISQLNEIGLGSWEGLLMEAVKQQNPVEYDHFFNKPHMFHLKGAESFQQLQDRAVNALQTIIRQDQGKHILVVTHWMVIKVILARFSGTSLSDLTLIPKPENGTITRLTHTAAGITII